MNYEFLYGVDYEYIKEYLRHLNDTELKKVLSDKKIKEKLINPENKYEFIWFVQEEPSRIVETLLDSTGIEILNNGDYLIDKYNAILTSGNKAVDTIMKNDSFCNVLEENFQSLSFYVHSINGDAAISLYKFNKNNGTEEMYYTEIYQRLNGHAQKEFLENTDIPKKYLKQILIGSKKESVEFMVQNKNIESMEKLSYRELLTLGGSRAGIGPLFKNKEILDSIVYCGNVDFYRTIIKSFENTTDMSEVENKREKYIEQVLSSYNKETGMLEMYNQIYLELSKLDTSEIYTDDIKKILDDNIKYTTERYTWNLAGKIQKVIDEKGDIKEFLIEESNIEMTNMIVDNSFKDYYPNVILDIKEVLNYNSGNESVVSDENLKIYEQLITLDGLDYEEKMTIYYKLKSDNWIEKFYDDVRKSKDSSYSKIKESIITKENSGDLFNKEQSEKYGTEIYELNGEDFFALVKSFSITTKDILYSNIDMSMVEGSSYSLIGNDNLDTFRSPKEDYCIVYVDFNPDNIVHIFPTDSFSRYEHMSSENGTNRINNISTPTELLQKSNSYNEILISQKNDTYRDDELNDSLSKPKPGFILCYDEVTDNIVESSKVTGLPILLVNTEKYKSKNSENSVNLLETMTGLSHNKYSYYNENEIDLLTEARQSRHK